MYNLTKLISDLAFQTGSTWVSQETYEHYFTRRNQVPPDLSRLIKEKRLVKYKNCITTPLLNKQENDIAIGAMRLQYANAMNRIPVSDIKQLIRKFEAEQNQGLQLHNQQVNAVIMAVNNNFSILTGGPGTGKTTVLSCIIYVMQALFGKQYHISLTSPTGKAAQVLKEATGAFATTINKRFGIGFSNRSGEIFYEDFLIIDESSFLDTEICSTVFNNIPDGKKVLFVGDIDQLPSVGPGRVLKDMIKSNCIPVTRLTHTFRQDNGTMLYQNICNIRKGSSKIIPGDDYHPICVSSTDNIYDLIRSEYLKSIETWGIEQTVVLIPYRKKGICTDAVNPILQKTVNHEKTGYRYHGTFFKKDDYVMQLQNREECVNGDIGQIVDVSAEGVTVSYVDGTVAYKPDELEQLALAYAMTIHKSQGSEYSCVIMVMLNCHKAMLNRNMLYTGITRAKKEVVLIYQEEAYETAVKTIADSNRVTFLSEKMQDLRAQYRMVYGA